MTDKELLNEIRNEINIPYNSGKDWINVQLDLSRDDTWKYGSISFGFDWKNELASDIRFSSLQECLDMVRKYKKLYYRE